MPRIGLTGGIASGKSEVGKLLAERGAVLIDSDVLAREVVAPGTDGLAAVVEEFGPELLGSDGALDRRALGARVFADPDARRRLEAIVHPRVRARAYELEQAAEQADPNAVVVHDIPLLVETGQADSFDLLVVVDVPTELQVERLTTLRGIDRAEAEARIAAQASREQRRAVADVVIDNSGTLAELADQVDRLWNRVAGID